MSYQTEEGPRRPYRKRRRAEQEEATRRRIVEATIGLHETVGPGRTTIAGVAQRAGVQRLTVYRHFPTEAQLLAACQQHWLERHPYPELSDLPGTDDPEERLRHALRLLYARHRSTGAMTSHILRDAQTMPLLAELTAHIGERLTRLAEELAVGIAPRPRGRRRLRLRAAIRHALDFSSWRSLADAGLSDDEAIDLLLTMIRAAAGASTGG